MKLTKFFVLPLSESKLCAIILRLSGWDSTALRPSYDGVRREK